MTFTQVTTRSLVAAFLSFTAPAHQYVISTVAGGAPPATPVRGLDMAVNLKGLTADASGNAYFTTTLHCVFKLDTNGIVTRIAGNARPGYSGDGGPAVNAQLNSPRDLAVDGAGNVFIADAGNNRVRKVLPNGIIVTVAGNGIQGFSGEGGPATSAQLTPASLAVDGAGNLFIADSRSNRVQKVSPEGIIVTVAGNGNQGFSGDGGPATSSSVVPYSVAVDGAGNLFIADSNSRCHATALSLQWRRPPGRFCRSVWQRMARVTCSSGRPAGS
jgi:hypothetical protein